jgi:hypothetical protein
MKVFLPLVLFMLLLQGCVRNNPLPVWLEINEWTLITNPNALDDQGALTHNFSDVTVYVDNKIIGIFELPCKIPVIASGDNVKIQLYPTVRNNGIASTKKMYPFVSAHVETRNLVPGETYVFNPQTMYSTYCNFWIEDFDAGSVKIETDQNFSTANLVVENNSALSLTGDYAHIALTNSDSMWVGITTEALVLPKGKEVYLEVNFKNTCAVLQGVKAYNVDGSTTDNPTGGMTAQSESTAHWKKIYIDLKETVSYSTNASAFKQYFKIALPTGVTQGDVYLDNIKVVHF